MEGLPMVNGVEVEIREALTNLVLNAVDAMPGGGTLTVRTGMVSSGEMPVNSPGRVFLEVTDTGVGMDEETRRRCLEPFFTTKGERGTGLGLPMVYGIARRHGAELEIKSEPGKGTTIRLDFPALVGGPAGPGRTEPPLLAPRRLRILAVDDDPILLKSLRDALEADGHIVVTATGGDQGIAAFMEALRNGPAFALVITDLGMPNVDGRKVASVIKESSRSTPVILLTGWGNRLMAAGDVPGHVDHVLSKPPKLHELRYALARCCQGVSS
jgi:CheY-like chemotaxis protein